MADDVTPLHPDNWGTQSLYEYDRSAEPKPSKPAPPPPPATAPGPTPRQTLRPGRSQDIISTVVELTGITVFTAGFWMIAPYLGLIVAGLCLILLGAALAR